MSFIVIFVLLLSVPSNGQIFHFFDPNNPVVSTNQGTVLGSKYVITNQISSNRLVNYYQFIGIPYAAPPTGDNRFRPAVFPNTRTTQLDCTGTNKVMCPQVYQRFTNSAFDIREDEDCLHLNIYVPLDNRPGTLPVLVYIHGGEFQYGGKDFFKPDFLLQAGGLTTSASNFIVVTINYRLGVLGFLSTDDYNAPGNNGIHDQVLALRWINENIAKFGGNPQNVTIMGHDAGGVSVSFHLLNMETYKLFNRAISISGTVFSPWAIHDNPLAQARDFAYRFSCGYRSDQIVSCLRSAPLAQLMSVSSEKDLDQNRYNFRFRPVVDRNTSESALLKDLPLNLYKNGQFNKKQYLVITTGLEGSLEYYLNRARMPKSDSIELKIAFLIRPFLKYYTNERILASAFLYRYFNRVTHSTTLPGQYQNQFGTHSNPSITNNHYSLNNHLNEGYKPYPSNIGAGNVGYTERDLDRLFCQMLGDFLYTGPIDLAARMHSTQANTMMMVFDYVGIKSFGAIQKDVLEQPSMETYGPTHFNDIFYSLPNDYDPSGLQGSEQNVARAYTRFLGEFILYGFPATSKYGLYSAEVPNYQLLQQNGQIISVSASSYQGYRTNYLDFINDYIYKLQDEAVLFPPYFPQQEYKSYQQATWTLAGVLILMLIIAVILAIILISRKRKEHNEMKNEQVRLKTRYNDEMQSD